MSCFLKISFLFLILLFPSYGDESPSGKKTVIDVLMQLDKFGAEAEKKEKELGDLSYYPVGEAKISAQVSKYIKTIDSASTLYAVIIVLSETTEDYGITARGSIMDTAVMCAIGHLASVKNSYGYFERIRRDYSHHSATSSYCKELAKKYYNEKSNDSQKSSSQ